ncbi:MAG: serine/threonine-protein kinase, partial [Planctomycetota bacterium]
MVPGTTFGRYKIERLLGQGAMGAAYLARQQGLDRQCVLKVIALRDAAVTPDIVERFQREARATAAISSDQVVKVYDVGSADGTPFIAMEFVNGCALDRWLVSKGRLAPEEAGRIVLDCARGLAAAHAAGVLHRDVKPANVLLTREGRAKVTDFGLAKLARPPRPITPGAPAQLTLPGMTVGTSLYMSPEQAESPETIDAR